MAVQPARRLEVVEVAVPVRFARTYQSRLLEELVTPSRSAMVVQVRQELLAELEARRVLREQHSRSTVSVVSVPVLGPGQLVVVLLVAARVAS